MTKNKIVLLACGSFNPPTFMHLRMFELAKDYFNSLGPYQVVGGIISPVHNGYGKKELIDSSHRCALLKLCLKGSDWIQLSDWECCLDSWTPTKKVLQYHQNKINSAISNYDGMVDKINELDEPSWIRSILRFQNNSDVVTVKLLCGADLIESFHVPNLWQEADIETIIGEHGIAVVTRNGVDISKIVYESDSLHKYKHNIHVIREWFANDISSTKIRRSLRRGESVKYLLPDNVIDYIQNQCLYGYYDNKYQTYQNSSMYKMSPQRTELIIGGIDTPDSGNYPRLSPLREGKTPRPGMAVPIRKVNEGNEVLAEEEEDEFEEEEEETRVEIQITEDGRIEVISDKETTV